MFYKSFLHAYTHTQVSKINTLYRKGVILNEKLIQKFFSTVPTVDKNSNFIFFLFKNLI